MPILKKRISLGTEVLEYTWRSSRRSRRLRLSVHPDGRVLVSAPRYLSARQVEKFLLAKAAWLLSKLAYVRSLPAPPVPADSRKEYVANQERALAFVRSRLEYFNADYGFTFNRISIRNQKTRWGSCSARGNLNFNYKIVLLPIRLADYIIVHELCHLRELNHGSKFWNLVARAIPDHQAIRKELKAGGLSFC